MLTAGQRHNYTRFRLWRQAAAVMSHLLANCRYATACHCIPVYHLIPGYLDYLRAIRFPGFKSTTKTRGLPKTVVVFLPCHC
ncbi:hypothetical protein C8R44DRAFT_786591 [Mycena epipterygia]|nr:hypothetical protein C8R44DRAFT_786591 [Mycena epipterygia]